MYIMTFFRMFIIVEMQYVVANMFRSYISNPTLFRAYSISSLGDCTAQKTRLCGISTAPLIMHATGRML